MARHRYPFTVSASVDAQTIDRLDAEAKDRRMNRSEVIREKIEGRCQCRASDLKSVIEQTGDPSPIRKMLQQARLEGDEYDVQRFEEYLTVYCDTIQEVLTDSLCRFHYSLIMGGINSEI